MILLIARDGVDSRLLSMDLAGEPFAHHVPAHWRSLQNSDIYVLGGGSAEDDDFHRLDAAITAGVDVLVIDADVWMSMAAMKRLLATVSHVDTAAKVVGRRNSGVGSSNERSVLAMYLPAALARTYVRDVYRSSRGPRSVRTTHDAVQGEEIDVLELDGAQPPARVEGLIDLTELERNILRARADEALCAGVRIRDPHSVAIRGALRCGTGVEIDLGVIIQGRVTLGDRVRVGAYSILNNATIGAGSTVHPYSMVEDAVIGANTFIGPYGRVRPGSSIGDSVQIGNFVEVKNSDIGTGSRINHLAFIGDATLGSHVTLGAGTITCNHDGIGIQRTQIGAGAYVGSGSELVAPVIIGENATIAAGSTITTNAPAGCLTIARARQVTISAWVRTSKSPDGA
jgi:acetyltransferase-like isoleucine patch superfamily enzyme